MYSAVVGKLIVLAVLAFVATIYLYDYFPKPNNARFDEIAILRFPNIRSVVEDVVQKMNFSIATTTPAQEQLKNYPRFHEDDLLISLKNEKLRRTPVILFWNLVYPNTSDRALPGNFNAHAFANCSSDFLPPNYDCNFTHDRKLLGKADAVVIQYRMWNEGDLPPSSYIRPTNQLWTFFIWESPAHVYNWDWRENLKSPHRLETMKGFFNWTMTYRLDSTVSYAYGRYRPRKTPEMSRKYDRFANKTRMAVWIAGNCNTASHRENYIHQLKQAGIDVDVIGSCNSNNNESYLTPELAKLQKICTRTKLYATTNECHRFISSTYKFYFSFENSLCRDYVTEKFYRGAMLDTIPVVMNGANMSLFAPPNSYIDTKDFETPKDLADFLKKVGSNSELYNGYFYWKPFYDVEYTSEGWSFRKNFCSLCSKTYQHLLLGDNATSSIYEDIEKWWVKDGQCYEGKSKWKK